MYLTWWCSKFTLRADLITATHLHPLTGQSYGPAIIDEYTQNVCGSSSGGGGLQLTSLSQAHAKYVLRLPVDRQQPRRQVRVIFFIMCVFLCIWSAIYPIVILLGTFSIRGGDISNPLRGILYAIRL